MLSLMIGGRNSGKYSCLLEIGYSSKDIGTGFTKPVLYKLNDLIKDLIEKNIEPVEFVKQQLNNVSDIIIVCDEVGCGVVPIDKNERQYREAVGRVCCEIAKQADVVDRVYCGIKTRIKG